MPGRAIMKENFETCVVRAPYRVDLAGGTLDIWPIYPTYPGCFTINLALPYYQWIEWKPHERWEYRFAHSKKLWRPGKRRKPPPEFEFVSVFHRAFSKDIASPYHVTITSDLPRGSGLGGSSALAVAFVTGASLLQGKTLSKRKIVLMARYLETQMLKTTTGTQDYLSATYGGLHAWEWTDEIWKRYPLNRYKEWVAHHLIVVFVGEPHLSILPNWQVVRKFVEGDASTRKHLYTIVQATKSVLEGLQTRDEKKVARALQKEMDARALLDDSILSKQILEIVQMKRKGVRAWKVCGAGGGGSLLFWVQQNKKVKLEAQFREEGLHVISIQSPGLPLHATFLTTIPH